MNMKPFYSPCEINKNHAHAEGLTALFLFNENQGNSCRNLIEDENNISLSNTSWVDLGIESNSNGEIGTIDNTNQIVNSDCGTIILKFKSNVSFNDGLNHFLFGQLGVSNNVGDFYLFKNGVDLYFLLYDATTFHYVILKTSKVPNWETGTQITLQWDRNQSIFNSDNMVFNIDGEYATPDLSGGETSWSTFTVNSSLSILNDLLNPTWFANGCIEYLNIYNKIVDVNILKDIYQDPYAMVYKPNYLSNFIGAYAPQLLPTTMDKRHKHFGANALPLGIGL